MKKLEITLTGFEWIYLWKSIFNQYTKIKNFDNLENAVLFIFTKKYIEKNYIEELSSLTNQKNIEIKKKFDLINGIFLYRWFLTCENVSFSRKALRQIEPQILRLNKKSPYYLFGNLKNLKDENNILHTQRGSAISNKISGHSQKP